ncbi:sulfur oxidation c-type cytochrome SoxX [Ideonella sp. 4Y11]|uniref:Sulfur oxidation c-type cytochrome SoxX n=1 Tax=Ideonella aquatica TaxID=2824119 RepID=A0A940YX42_9BURK|nr:sulfur oxidation c-type cytochrome SoxX [Ideonella aquatica]MBQ0960820.1 sulfur oxidation c-type cytochrome SoxX [Ideonella aquatica]
MKKTTPLLAAVAVVALAGCASAPSPAELQAQFQAMLKSSFRDQGIATIDRLNQDAGQAACSTGQTPSPEQAKVIEAEALATVKPPSDGKYLGDWREGEKLAQNGRGMTWTDKSADPSANGANCYNCHQITKAEISYGTIGPSLYQFGKLRGVSNPSAPEAQAMVQYTWGKINNAWAYNACSNMPRFGHKKLLNEQQIKHVMALLLDPASPVNAQ